MRAVVALVEPEIGDAKVGRKIHDQARPRVEHLPGDPGGLAVLETQEDDVPPSRGLAGA